LNPNPAFYASPLNVFFQLLCITVCDIFVRVPLSFAWGKVSPIRSEYAVNSRSGRTKASILRNCCINSGQASEMTMVDRWIVERTHAWLGNFRRLVVRYDRSLTIYGAFFHICFMIVLRRVVQ